MTARVSGMPTDYGELVVIGHTCDYAITAGLAVASECPICGHRTYQRPESGLKMPLQCWDGTDIFLIDELGFVLVTEPVRGVIVEHNFSGVELTPIAAWHDPMYMIR